MEALQEAVRDFAPVVRGSVLGFDLVVQGSAPDSAPAFPGVEGRLLPPRVQAGDRGALLQVRLVAALGFIASLEVVASSHVSQTGGSASAASTAGSSSATDFSFLTALAVSRHSSRHSSSAAGSFLATRSSRRSAEIITVGTVRHPRRSPL